MVGYGGMKWVCGGLSCGMTRNLLSLMECMVNGECSVESGEWESGVKCEMFAKWWVVEEWCGCRESGSLYLGVVVLSVRSVVTVSASVAGR